MFYKPNLIHVILDAAVIAAAVVLAYLIRFEFDIADIVMVQHILWYLPYILLMQLIANYAMRVYDSLWRYFGLFDAFKIALAIGLTSGIILIYDFSMPLREIPLGVLGNYIFIAFLFLSAGRVIKRQLTYIEFGKPVGARHNTMIIGAGFAGTRLLNELFTKSEKHYKPVIFIDDDNHKLGKRIGGLLVAGKTDDISRCIEQYNIKEVVIVVLLFRVFVLV